MCPVTLEIIDRPVLLAPLPDFKHAAVTCSSSSTRVCDDGVVNRERPFATQRGGGGIKELHRVGKQRYFSLVLVFFFLSDLSHLSY